MTRSKKWMLSVVALVLMAAVAAPALAAGPLKVYILAGQSNMEGAGRISMDVNRNEGKGSLEYVVKDPTMTARTKHTVDAAGKFIVRKDVWICYGERKGGLTAGYGARKTSIGPEFAFGHAMGEAHDQPVLIIKTAWGGKSLQKDFRPPSSGLPSEAELKEILAKTNANKKKRNEPQVTLDDIKASYGPYYRDMLKIVKGILGDIKAHYPAYDGKGYEIAGFGWHQGWNDGCSAPAVAEYEQNMANFIRDVRKALGKPNLPFVIADSGFGGVNQKVDRRLGIVKAQNAVAAYPEFKGNVFTVKTPGFFRPKDQSPGGHGYHWNENALTYFLIGEAMGKAMIDLSGPAVKKVSHPDTTGAGWKPFLKADLSDTIHPKGVWSVTDGVLTATEDQNLWSKKQYEDFIIDLEFKTDEDTNSGVIVHCSDTKAWIPNSVEIQIADDHGKWEKAPKSWQCGGIFGHLPATRQKVVKKPGQWNRYTVTCKGKIITVVLNGEQTCEMDMSKWTSAKKNPDGSDIPGWLNKPKAGLPLKGHVGFQGKHAGAPIYFRNIKIKEL